MYKLSLPRCLNIERVISSAICSCFRNYTLVCNSAQPQEHFLYERLNRQHLQQHKFGKHPLRQNFEINQNNSLHCKHQQRQNYFQAQHKQHRQHNLQHATLQQQQDKRKYLIEREQQCKKRPEKQHHQHKYGKLQQTSKQQQQLIFSQHNFSKCHHYQPQYLTRNVMNILGSSFTSLIDRKNISFVGEINFNRSSCRLYSTTDNKKKRKDSKWLTIPNVMTGFRILAAPYIGYLVLTQDFTWAFGLFMLAAATDSIDGWVARNFESQSSILGAFIDPLADKVLVTVLTFTLTWANIIPAPLCFMIIARDLMIMFTAGHFHYKHLEPPRSLKQFMDFENSKVQMKPTKISKYNTFLQLGLVALSISAPVFDFVNHPYLQAYWYLVGSTTVFSGLSYVVKDKSTYFVD